MGCSLLKLLGPSFGSSAQSSTDVAGSARVDIDMSLLAPGRRARRPGRETCMSSQHDDDATRRADILIVDDTPASSNLLAVILANEGFELRTAASGEEALSMIAQSAPRLVLLDVVMPGLS